MEFNHTTHGQRVVFGTGRAVENVVAQLSSLGLQRVVMIAGSSASGVAEEIGARAPIVARVSEVIQHVPVELVNQAIADATDARADVIVSIGGGSATGLAKAIALTTGLPIIAVPTTFAGSEATDVWGVTTDGRKTTGSDPRVLPAAVIYDASLTSGLPEAFAVASGLNAIAHAIDGFWAPRVDPINTALATESLRTLVPGLRALHAGHDDFESREQLLYGAYLAAVAFASAGSGMHHKICHVLGGRFGLPHAEMHSIVLRYVTAFNVPFAPDAARRISEAFDGVSAEAALFAFGTELDAPKSLAEFGFRQQDIAEAARLAFEAVPPSNPRPVTQHDLGNILRLAWSGEYVSKGQL